ncbi:MAG: hypothetical protein IJR14_02020 [Synergistaceae bacterium]|nr:hypothetical protein [Synergistaceae bacterium]
MTDKERERLRQEASRGHQWKVAREVLHEFCEAARRSIVKDLESGSVSTPQQGLYDRLAELRVLNLFKRTCESYIEQGINAERRLGEDA